MNKREMIQSIIADMRSASGEQSSAKESAYFTALKDSKFKAVDSKIRELTVKTGKASADGKSTAQLNSELAKATAERDKLFASYYTPAKTAVCAKCGNTGYVKNKLCACVMKEYTRRLGDVSGLSQKAPKSFSANLTAPFKDKATQESMKKIYSFLAKYCEKFPDVKAPNIVLSGPTGTGKTYAAEIVASALLERGHSVLYMTAFSLIQRFKEYIFNFEKTEKLDALFDCDFLIIDDLGTEPTIKNITQEYLYNVINERVVNKKAFMITTNLSPDALAQRYDQRLASRILSVRDTVTIEMKGKDLRLG